MKTTLTKKFWLALTVFSLMGQVAWVVENMYLNVFIYKMFAASASDISLMVSASAVSATLTTVRMGALSDRIGIMKNGRLLAVGTPEELKQKVDANTFENAFVAIVKEDLV